MIHFNCRILHTNFHILDEYSKSLKYKPDIIAIHVTWLEAYDSSDFFHLDGYKGWY